MIRILREMTAYMRGERPPPLPDKVTWIVGWDWPQLHGRTAPDFVAHVNESEDHTDQGGDLWHLDDILPEGLKLTRGDGRYRWRDPGFHGL